MYTKEYLKNNPPKYENLTDKTSLENRVCEELTNAADELQTLVRNIQDLNESFVVDPAKFISKGKNNPFGGYKLDGVVKYTIVDGEVKYKA